MTPKQLEAIGCKKIHWNANCNGGYFEYYIPVWGDGLGYRDARLSVVFKDDRYPDVPFMVWLVIPQSRVPMKGVKTIAQFKKVHEFWMGKAL
jgi:hypothetical protein